MYSADEEATEDGKTPDGLLTVGRKGTEVLDTTPCFDFEIVPPDLPPDVAIAAAIRDTTEFLMS